MADSALAVVPRRVTATAVFVPLPEPRFAWRVPVAAPWTVEQGAAWRIMGCMVTQVTVGYEAEASAPGSVAKVMYEAAEEAAANAADWPVVRWVPLDGDGGALHPSTVAFSHEHAVARAAAAAKAAGGAQRTRRRLGKSLNELVTVVQAE